MAPKKTAAKRTAADTKATQPAAKKPKTDKNQEAVLEALKDVNVSDSCRQMLTVFAQTCLNVAADARHESQVTFVRMLGEALEMAVAAQKEAVATAKAAVEASEAAKAPMDEALTAAQAKLTEATEAVTAKKASLDEATKTSTDAEKVLKGKQEEQKNGDVELILAKDEKTKIDAAIETNLKVIVDGENPAEMKKHFVVLKPILANLELDDSLKTALPSTCTKEKAARGAFDNMVIEQLQKTLGEKKESLTKLIDNAAPAAEARSAAVKTAEEALSATKGALEAAEAAVKIVEEAETAARQTVSDAEAALSTYSADHKKVTDELKAKELAVQNFTTYNVSCFELLRDRVTKVEAPPAAPAPAAAEEVLSKTADATTTEGAKDAAVTVGGA